MGKETLIEQYINEKLTTKKFVDKVKKWIEFKEAYVHQGIRTSEIKKLIEKYPNQVDYIGITEEELETFGLDSYLQNLTIEVLDKIIENRKLARKNNVKKQTNGEDFAYGYYETDNSKMQAMFVKWHETFGKDDLERVIKKCKDAGEGFEKVIESVKELRREKAMVQASKDRENYDFTKNILLSAKLDRNPFEKEVDAIDIALSMGYAKEDILKAAISTIETTTWIILPYLEKILRSNYTNNIVKRVNQMELIPEIEVNCVEDVTSTYFNKEKAKKLLDDFYQNNTSDRRFQLDIMDEMKNFIKSDSKATILDLLVGSGKTYLTKYIGILANLQEKKFVYACQNKAVLYEAIDEALKNTDGLYDITQNLLYIPSILDSYSNFFSNSSMKPKEENEEDQDNIQQQTYKDYYPSVSEIDIKNTQASIDKFIDNYEKIVAEIRNGKLNYYKKNTIYKNTLKYLYVLRDSFAKIPDVLNHLRKLNTLSDVEKSSHRNLKKEQEETMLEFDGIERTMRKCLNNICTLDYKGNLTAFIKEYPWITKLYPGTRYDTASLVYMTFNKTERGIRTLGPDGNANLSFSDDNAIVFLDESDRYCNVLLETRINESTKYNINILDFIKQSYATLTSLYDIETKKFLADYEMIHRTKEAELVASTNAEEIFEKAICSLSDLVEKYRINQATVAKYNMNTEEQNGAPCLNVNSYGAEVITGTNKTYDVNIEKLEDSNQLSIFEQDISKDKELKDKAETVEDNQLPYKRFIKESKRCINHVLSVIRYCIETYEMNNSNLTREDVKSTIIDRLGFKYNDAMFIKANLLNRRKSTVRFLDDYARGYSINTLEDATYHSLETYLKSFAITQLPEYFIANMVLNQNKVIFSSGTAKLMSLTNIDLNYIEDIVKDKQSQQLYENNDTISKLKKLETTEDNTEKIRDKIKSLNKENEDLFKKISSPVIYDMTNCIKNAETMYNETQKKLLEHSKVHPFIYDRNMFIKEGQDPIYVEYAETVSKIGEDILNLPFDINSGNSTSKLSKSIESFCFVANALVEMIEKEAHVGILFANALPEDAITNDGKNYYTTYTLEQLAECVKRRYSATHEISVEIKKGNVKNEKEIKQRLDQGITEKQYLLIVTAYQSLGAGSNLHYHKKNEYDVVDSTEYDLDAIFCDEIRQIIPSVPNNDRDVSFETRINTMLTAEYYYIKYANFAKQLGISDEKTIMAHIPRYLKSIWTNIPNKGNEKNITKDDPLSAYYQSCAAKFLQAFARMDRGKKKSENIILGVTDSLIENGGINKTIYHNVPTSYLFDILLKKLHDVDLDKICYETNALAEEYRQKNIIHVNKILDLLSKMRACKQDGRDVPISIRKCYEKIRTEALTFGYSKEERNILGYFMCKDPSIYKVYIPKNASDKDLEKAQLINKKRTNKGYDIGKTCMQDLRYYRDNKMFGKGWESLFEDILPFEDDIYRFGFKYPPFAETVYICQGAFYEKIFEALSLPDGVLDIGYKLCPLNSSQYEDFDFMYEGTNVYIDVKGYSETRKVTSNENLEEKLLRCKAPCAVVYLNAKVCEYSVNPSGKPKIKDVPVEHGLYLVHGVGSRNDDAASVMERVRNKMDIVKKLCRKYKREEQE